MIVLWPYQGERRPEMIEQGTALLFQPFIRLAEHPKFDLQQVGADRPVQVVTLESLGGFGH